MLAASVLAAVLGSVHAFSVFLDPLEQAFAASRGAVSLTYSLALGFLTLAVLFGHRIYARWAASVFVLGVCSLAATGALIAGFAPSLSLVWLGYSLLFGAANGLGYGFGLQLAAQANPGRAGFAMGVVTAAYALGAGVAPPLFVVALTLGGFTAAMIGLAAVLIFAGGVCAILLRASKAKFTQSPEPSAQTKVTPTTFALLWIGYGAGVAAGLMTIGHATGIATGAGFTGPIWVSPAAIAVANLLGSLVAGRLTDRAKPAAVLTCLALVTAGTVLTLGAIAGPGSAIPLLAAAGFAYGGTIAAYPAVIAKLFGMAESPRIYGRVFTAWGAAGLFAPSLAGALFDLSGTYQIALLTAAALAVLSAAAVLALFQSGISRAA